MALRNLILAKRLKERKTEMTALLEREEELVKRQEELEQSIEEAERDEDLDLIEEAEKEFNTDKEKLLAEKNELQVKIDEIEQELSELEDEDNEEEVEEPKGERKQMSKLITRGAFKGMNQTDAEVLVKRDDAQKFLTEIRSAMAEKRAITGGDVLVPEVFLGLVREQVYGLSKLAPKVWLRRLKGNGRYTIAGAIPEGVWTEACANLNELELVFSEAEVDAYKVGGFVAVCNALLEDADLDLANEVLTSISQAIAIALDKAILYGTGTKMPTGIVKALDGVNGKPNLIGIDEDLTGEKFYAELVAAFGKTKSHGSVAGRFYAMSEATFAQLQVKALSINAAGAIVSGQTQTMPILGGDIIVTDVVADGTIIGGYGQHYLLAERAEVKLARSEHVQFIEDNTVFKGTARYDGKVIFTDAFVAVAIGEADEDTGAVDAPAPNDVEFASDAANADESEE